MLQVRENEISLRKWSNSTARGIMWLDGARGKKQVWRPHVRI